MDAVKPVEFAGLCNVSRAAVSQAIKAGRLSLRSDGLLSISDPINAKYMADKRARDKVSKLQGVLLPESQTPKSLPRDPSFKDIPGGLIDLDDAESFSGDLDPDAKVGLSLNQRDRLASAKLKEAQEARHILGLAQMMGELIDRKEVIHHDLMLGAELKTTLLGMPKIQGPRMYMMIKDGATEADFVRYLEDAMVGALQSIVSVLEQPYD